MPSNASTRRLICCAAWREATRGLDIYTIGIDQRSVKMASVTLSTKFQISIPEEARETLDLKPGQRLAFLCVGKSVNFVPQPQIEGLFDIGKGANPNRYRDRCGHRECSDPKPKPRSTSPATPGESRRAA